MLMDTGGRRHFVSSLVGGLAGQSLLSGQFVPKQSDRPKPLAGDEPGFSSIFDGKSLAGWEGDPKYWRVADGVMLGEITPETIIKSNTFIIWRGGSPKDFELKVDYRITSGGNSGINYRSVVVPDKVTPSNQFAMRGYQCDIDGQNRYTGNNYEEKGRLFLAERGEVTHVTGHLVIRGNILMHMINGQLMSVTIDDDAAGRMMEGLIGVQVHVGPPMKVEYKNWRLKTL